MVDYEDLIQTGIHKMQSIVKAVAVREANQVDGLEVDDDGTVTALNGEPFQVFADLLDRYENISGDVALNLIANEIKQEYGDIGTELPEKIKNHM